MLAGPEGPADQTVRFTGGSFHEPVPFGEAPRDRGAGVQRAFHVADERVAGVLAGEVQMAAGPLRRSGPIVVTWPGAGKEYEAFVQVSPGQSMKRLVMKLARSPV